jgi:hypothetical protein
VVDLVFIEFRLIRRRKDIARRFGAEIEISAPIISAKVTFALGDVFLAGLSESISAECRAQARLSDTVENSSKAGECSFD